MKKSLICGAASLLMATASTFGAFATDNLGGSHDVTVGTTDETIYAVDITWGDMTFDWKYNTIHNDYAFIGKDTVCQTPADQDLYYLANINNLYTKYDCTEPISGEVNPETRYYSKIPTAYMIKVWDESVNGKIKAQATFAPTENYSWVKGVFSDLAVSNPMYIYSDNAFSEYTETDGTFTSQMGSVPIPGQANHQLYDVLFHLEVNRDVARNTNPVSPSDKIGTVTINIEPDLN